MGRGGRYLIGRRPWAGVRLAGSVVVWPRVVRPKTRLQLRAELFDLFNHPNSGQPGNVVGSPAFGRLTNTRLATGESGSSRQIQLAARVML
jgi:hypothetical protein